MGGAHDVRAASRAGDGNRRARRRAACSDGLVAERFDAGIHLGEFDRDMVAVNGTLGGQS
jgi:hypothetical protein